MPRRKLLTLEQAVHAAVSRHGGVRSAARATGVDKGFISRLMTGKKVAPSAETLESLGLRAVPLYEVLARAEIKRKDSIETDIAESADHLAGCRDVGRTS